MMKPLRRTRILLGDKEKLPYQDAEKQLLVRFLSISSYLLKGDFDKGVDELQQFSKYYSGMGAQQFKINEIGHLWV